MIAKTVRLALAAALLSTAASAIAPAPARATERNELIAAPIAMVLYVTNHCPTMRPNKVAFQTMLASLGVTSMDDIPVSASRQAHMEKLVLEEQPSSAVCPMIWEQFGTNGTSTPDLFLRQ